MGVVEDMIFKAKFFPKSARDAARDFYNTRIRR